MIKKTLLTIATTVTACLMAIAPLTNMTTNAQSSSATNCDSLVSQSWTIGQTGSNVVALQDCLTDTGHFSFFLGSTGYYGPITQAAIASYNAGYTPNIGPNPATNCDSLVSQSWTIGQTGSNVVALQDCLTDTGHFSFFLGSTGYYGPITQAAIASYNANNDTVKNVEDNKAKAVADKLAAEKAAADKKAQDAARLKAEKDAAEKARLQAIEDEKAKQAAATAAEKKAQELAAQQKAAAIKAAEQQCDALTSRSWSIGNNGDDVVALQDCLTEAGEYGSTGYYGPLTQAALASHNNQSTARASLASYYRSTANTTTTAATNNNSSGYTGGVSGNCDSYRSLVAQYDWNVDTMMYAMYAESGCNPNAVGDQYVIAGLYAPSCGLLQVRTLAGRPSCAALQDPATNVATSYQIWLSQGYSAWSTLH